MPLRPRRSFLLMETIKRLYRSPQFRRTALCLASVYRSLLRARARDFTDGVCRRSSLVLAPHPDDETLGCGVTIMRKIEAGQPVQVVIATDGRHSHHSARISASELAGIRQREAIDACRVLGLAADKVRFLEYEDQALLGGVAALTDQLRRIIVEIGPQEIYLPSAIDSNPDHRALNAAALAAIEQTAADVDVYEYPIWFWDPKAWVDMDAHPLAMAWQLLTRPIRTLFTLRPIFVRSEDYLARKRAAFAAHRSQATNLTGEEDWAVMDQQTLNLLIREDELFFLRLRPKARHA
jgi:LmbE family N-acetylglucosaminyl deacetylase